ncbi:MAG: alanine--glyoxylate aminotransferase family protein [Verrucomicrobiota bacterium]
MSFDEKMNPYMVSSMHSTTTSLSSERLLLGPGPCNISDRVSASLSRPLLGHLDPLFLDAMDTCKERLRDAFQTKNEVTFPISGTGSAGMEFLLANFLEPGDRFLVGVNGVFGTRLMNLAKKMGAQVESVEADWGSPIDVSQLCEKIRSFKPKIVAVVNGETSTGVYQRGMHTIGTSAHDVDALFLADCVTSLTGMPMEIDTWGVDLAFSGTQKCLGCPPGLSPITLSDRAIQRFKERSQSVPSFYFDLEEILKYVGPQEGTPRSYHHTAPISMIFALNEALQEVLEEGLETRCQRHAAAASLLIEKLEPFGFTPLVAAEHRLNPLTTFQLPDEFDEQAARRHLLYSHQIEVGAGLGPLAGKVWRIGLMAGNANSQSVDHLVDGLVDYFEKN